MADESEPRPAPPMTTDTLDRPLTARERAVVLSRIQALIEFWGISTEELAAAQPFAPSAPVAAAPSVKYRHPVTGLTWDGVGPHPDWLRHALLQEGFRVDELRPEPGAVLDGSPPVVD